MKGRLKVLATSYDFFPLVGGISNCAESILKAMTMRDEVVVRLLARSDTKVLPFELVPMKFRRRSVVAALQYIVHLAREVSRERPDVLIHFLWWPEAFSAFLFSLFSRKPIPYFIFVHGMEILESPRKFSSGFRCFLKRLVFSRAAGVIAVSDFTREVIEKQGIISALKVRTIYHGVDSHFFTAAPTARKKELNGKHVFLTVARLEPFKGIDRVIEAMAEAVKINPNIYYRVAGQGLDRERLERLVRSLCLEKYVELLGSVSLSELRDLYRTADCFVLMTRNAFHEPNFEGFGISILEAAACGVPALVGQSGGMEEAISFGECGWSVPPLDRGAIRDALIAIAAGEKLRLEKGANARKKAENYFSWDRTAKEVLCFISGDLGDQK